jgi:ABC-type Fe3+/spermidine/putrescine transport system ATPase subunit
VDAALAVPDGETLVVLGPSGSGKTLLLESLGGFHDHDGHVRLDGADVREDPPERRGFGFVFQDYALFPHMTVRENVAFGARYHEAPRDPDDLLASLGVADLAERTPATLSGGEQQRVALARALAIAPEVLLLDEPLSALDVPTRQELREDLAEVLADRTAVYVTHDRTTARALADRIAVMRDGAVVQHGAPDDVFDRPASPFVARFVGANVLPAAVTPDPPADAVQAAIRPEHVELRQGGDAEVVRVVPDDAASRVRVRLAADGDTEVDAFTNDPPAVGDRVGVSLPAEHVTYFDGRP